jgi:hypothetical protein
LVHPATDTRDSLSEGADVVLRDVPVADPRKPADVRLDFQQPAPDLLGLEANDGSSGLSASHSAIMPERPNGQRALIAAPPEFGASCLRRGEEPMPLEVMATVVLNRPQRAVRRYLIARWIEPDSKRIVVARNLRGAAGSETADGPAITALPAFDEAESRVEDESGVPSRQAFEVEAYQVAWRYEMEPLGAEQTALHVRYAQGGFMARVPWMRSLMTKAMERETARLQRWADGSN